MRRLHSVRQPRRISRCLHISALAIALSTIGGASCSHADQAVGDVPHYVPFYRVEMEDNIWAPRTQLLVQRTLPHAFHNTERALEDFRQCAAWLASGGQSPTPPPHRFRASDLFKVMEGAALMLQAQPNPAIETQMDEIIEIVAAAQTADGYLYVPHIVHSYIENEMGDRPYSYVLHSHELYNMGHMYEAAVAYAQATGKTKFLDIAEKNAQHVNHVFFEGDPAYNDGRPVNQAPGHEEIELGLVKLYGQTGKQLYLDMAKRFLAIRGVTYHTEGHGIYSPEYAQQQAPVAEQHEAVGHAVRAMYLYAAMAEVDSLQGADDYTAALDAIWHDVVDGKMHISGGLGAVPGIEGFGPRYVLPNKDTYLETCAAVGNVLFNVRMFLKHERGEFVDVAEAALYNNCLAGVGLDGQSFFYPNPLEADEGHGPRSAWFGTACCPSNIARLVPQISGYMYAVRGKRLYCVLYGQNEAQTSVAGVDVKLSQRTAYPYDGAIELELDPAEPTEFELALRIPTWAGQQFVPGKLYSFTDEAPAWSVEVNGTPLSVEAKDGFATIRRQWEPGDKVALRLPMPVRVSTCIDEVEANRDRVAISRGPLLFCAEGIDNGGFVQRLFFPGVPAGSDAKVQQIADGPLAGLPQITLPAAELTESGVKPAGIKMVPYFAWSNRDRGSMNTWIGTNENVAEINYAAPENLKFAGVTASHTFEGDTVDAVRMKHTPRNSSDTSIRRWTSWSEKGREAWVEIDFGSPQSVRSIGVYFYDDNGGVQLPGEWHVETPVGDGWQRLAIYNTDSYSSLPDVYNTVHPAEPLTAERLRIVMRPRHGDTCVGILSVDVETNDERDK